MSSIHPSLEALTLRIPRGVVMLGLILGAAILGVIIAVMEDGEFPGWFNMIACVLAALLPANLVNAFLPPELFLVGLAVGALCAGLAISALCGMSFKRATIAASIYFACQIVLAIGLIMAFGA